MKRLPFIILLVIAIASACQNSKLNGDFVVTPQGDTLFLNDTTPPARALTFKEIKQKGEIRLLAFIGEKTYYKYNDHPLGTQYLILQQFAMQKGLELTVDSCKDSTEVLARLKRFEGDVAAMETPGNLRAASKELQDSIDAWFNDTIISYVERMEKDWLLNGGIVRHEYPMYIDLDARHLSQYDELFQRYAKFCKWDWRLIAAQCYQESTFDRQAISWAGARGLMQIMPQTAEDLGLPFSEMFTPDMNIKAAVKYISQLQEKFAFIENTYERENFVLAAYNAGPGHVFDAIALAEADSVPITRWDYVSPYILLLSEPEAYRLPMVKCGGMRGTETYNYVKRIREIYEIYGGNNFITCEPYKTPTVGVKKTAEDIRREKEEAKRIADSIRMEQKRIADSIRAANRKIAAAKAAKEKELNAMTDSTSK